MKTKFRELQAPYGKICIKVLKDKELTRNQKLVYAVIAAKQGNSRYAKVTYFLIAEALGISIKTVQNAVVKLIGLDYIKRLGKIRLQTKCLNKQYGMIELEVLIAQNLSSRAKYLYLIYCVVGSKEDDANIWGSKSIQKTFYMSSSTYYYAHKELIGSQALTVYGTSRIPGIQSVNINKIVRAEHLELKKNQSWDKPDIDKWLEEHLDEILDMEIKKEENDAENVNNKLNGRSKQGITNSNLCSNLSISNLNKKTNEKNQIHSRGISQPSNSTSEEYDQLLTVPLKSFSIAHTKLKKYAKDYSAPEIEEILNHSIISFAFKFFDIMCETAEENGLDTSNYALNLKNILTLSKFMKKYRKSHIDIYIHHVKRLTKLAIVKHNKKYISFSYIFGPKSKLVDPPSMWKLKKYELYKAYAPSIIGIQGVRTL